MPLASYQTGSPVSREKSEKMCIRLRADAVGYRLSVLRTCGLAPEETHKEAWSKAMPGSRFLEVEKLDLDTESDTRSS
jgi:hypothetical protein